ncbi:unnamed protein product [Gadus morhua 'NCC']
MAEEIPPPLKHYLTCNVCTEIFKDPVSLGCHHSFCSSCLNDFWAQAENKNCPGHTLVPLEEQVQELKQQLRPDLTALQARRRRHQELEETYKAMVPHLKKQRVKTERRIRAEFEQLHRFLREEEEAIVKALREEEEQKRKRILLERKTLQEQIRSLSEGLSAVEADLQKDGLSFLSASTRSRTSARALLSGSDPQLLPGALLDEAKHLGNLAHRVWEKMGQRTTFSPVTLDPNTASCRLSLSDDLTSVRRSDVIQKVPNNPERFTKYAEVLGSEGVSSGEHCWEVEVEDHPHWTIGVVKESVDRRGERTASPDNGNWCLLHRSGKYTQCTGNTLTLKRTPERIRVQLDYDGGEVSFYDPEDMTLIYTHQHTFTDNIFPYFSLGPAVYYHYLPVYYHYLPVYYHYLPVYYHYLPVYYHYLPVYYHYLPVYYHYLPVYYHYLPVYYHYLPVYYHYLPVYYHYLPVYYHYLPVYYHYLPVYYHYLPVYSLIPELDVRAQPLVPPQRGRNPALVLLGNGLLQFHRQPELIWSSKRRSREETRRRPGGDREEQGGDQETRRTGGDQEGTRRRPGGDQEETRRRPGDQEETRRRPGGEGRRPGGDQETRRRPGGDQEEKGGDQEETRRPGGDQEETRRRPGDQEETRRRPGGDQEEQDSYLIQPT